MTSGSNTEMVGLREDLLRVSEVRTPQDLLARTVGFTQGLGFETVSTMVVVDHPDGSSDFHTLHHIPPAYSAEFNNVELGHRCPVMQHCKNSSRPLAWTQATYTAAGLGGMWECQAAYGFHAGIAVAWHLPQGRHFFIGVDRDQALPRCSIELSRMTAELQLFAVHALDAALQLLAPPVHIVHREPRLTARELVALRWTMEGKTAWEVGRILGISDQTVARHLQHATRKLDAVNKHQAVIKALRLGLLS